jgi:hypothetical protein
MKERVEFALNSAALSAGRFAQIWQAVLAAIKSGAITALSNESEIVTALEAIGVPISPAEQTMISALAASGLAWLNPPMKAAAVSARVQMLMNHQEAYTLSAVRYTSRAATALVGLRLGQLLYDNNVASGGDGGVSVLKSATPEELGAASINPANLAALLQFIETLISTFGGIKPAPA